MLNTKRKRAPGEPPRRSFKEKYQSNGISNPKFTVEVWDEHDYRSTVMMVMITASCAFNIKLKQ